MDWTCSACTYCNDDSASPFACRMCSTPRPLPSQLQQQRTSTLMSAINSMAARSSTTESSPSFFPVCGFGRVLAGALSGALTGMCAMVGAFTGAVTGALAGRATDSGLLRGAGLGAVAGAVLSVEVLEASRAYWQSERTGPLPSSSVAEFIEDLLNGRLADQQVVSPFLSTQRWQVNVAEMSYEELYEMFGPSVAVPKGASEASLEKLPWHTITGESISDGAGETNSCTICLQEMLQGESARSLPSCHHVFHMSCVDKWLMKQGSCPVCRQDV